MRLHQISGIALFALLSTVFLPYSNASAVVCASCKSIAEGVDRTAAAKANSWTGTIIGVNFGDQSVIVTDGTALDHIKSYAQRYVKISDETEVVRGDEGIGFEDLDVGQKITSYGAYNAKTRTIDAVKVVVVAKVANAPSAITLSDVEAVNGEAPVEITETVSDSSGVIAAPEPTKPLEKEKVVFVRNLQMGSKGTDVTELQKVLIAKGFLKMPSGVAYGLYGSMTRDAVKKYQKSMKISQTGTIGPQTRASLNKIGRAHV